MVNKVILIGRLGRDPEIRNTADGTTVAQFSMVTSEKYKDKEYSEWHNIVAWRKLGEIAGEYLKKGSLVYIEGRIQSREYEGRDGVKRKVVEINASTMKMLGGKSDLQKRVDEAKEVFDSDFPTEDDDVPM